MFKRGGAAKRRDVAEAPIADALRAVGARVERVSGRGLPDLLVGFRGRYYALEVKTGSGRQTAAQRETGYPVVRSVDEALRIIGASRQERGA